MLKERGLHKGYGEAGIAGGHFRGCLSYKQRIIEQSGNVFPSSAF